MNNALTYIPVAQQSAPLRNFGRDDAADAPVLGGLPSSKLTSAIERSSLFQKRPPLPDQTTGRCPARRTQMNADSDTGTASTWRISVLICPSAAASPPASSTVLAHAGSENMSCVPSSAIGLSTIVVLRRAATDSEPVTRESATIVGKGTGTLAGTFQPKRSWANCLRRKRSPIEYVPAKTCSGDTDVNTEPNRLHDHARIRQRFEGSICALALATQRAARDGVARRSCNSDIETE